MSRTLTILFLTLTGLKVTLCQETNHFPIPEKGDLPGLKITSSKNYNGSSLFGYINGGAELYLEYGFISALVLEMDYMSGKYKAEIFKMTDPVAAFGIFSVSKFRCPAAPDFSEFTCQGKYQLQISSGQYYVSIINRTGTSADSIALIKIGKTIADKIKDKNFDFTSFISAINPKTILNNSVLVKGKLGIMNGSPDLEDFFLGIKNFEALIIKDLTKTIISVRFANNSDYIAFLELHKLDTSLKKTAESDKYKNITISLVSENHLMINIMQ